MSEDDDGVRREEGVCPYALPNALPIKFGSMIVSTHHNRVADDAAYAEVGQHRMPICSHEHVVRLQVKNHNAVIVKLLEAIQDVSRHPECLGEGQLPACSSRGKQDQRGRST